ncbi:MAG: DUF4292 domain-containing protein [Acidobacteria bacterium]|nr:DUF4292 domain-containing protein [Acidobacteriota bacterium]
MGTLVFSTSCLVRRRRIEQTGRPPAPLLTAGLDQLAETIKQRYEAIETLSATVDLEPSILSPSKSEIAEYKDVRGFILFRKSAWIRVIAQYPVVRGTAFDMVSDGATFRLLLPSRNLFLTGLNAIAKPSPRKLENLRPQHLLDALLVRPPDPSTEEAVLENWTDATHASYIVHILGRDSAGRLHLARRLWFDRASLELVRQQVFNGGGDLVTDARYEGWERHGGIMFPALLIISRPQDEYELSIHFLKTGFNEPMGEEKFDLQPPPGVKVQKVGEEEAQPAPRGR